MQETAAPTGRPARAGGGGRLAVHPAARHQIAAHAGARGGKPAGHMQPGRSAIQTASHLAGQAWDAPRGRADATWAWELNARHATRWTRPRRAPVC